MLSPSEVLRRVVQVLDDLKIPYMVGGSFASSIHGIPRMTQDADLVVDIQPHQAILLARIVEEDFYIDQSAISDAIRRRSSFNIIHLDSMFKVDLFVLTDREYDRASFARRRLVTFLEEGPFQLAVCAPEELVVTKLEWYDLGGRSSERQYRDVLGVIATQERAGTFDRDHARRLARQLGLTDLLQQAQDDATGSCDPD